MILVLWALLASFKTIDQNALSWDKYVGRGKVSVAMEFFSVLVQNEEEEQLLNDILEMLQETKIEKDDYNGQEMLTFVLHKVYGDSDITEPQSLYIRVGKPIPDGTQLDIQRKDVADVTKQFSWLSFSYSGDPIPFGNNEITWYGVNNNGKYYTSETFQYDSQWAEGDVWVAPIEVRFGQDELIGIERGKPENGWHLFKDYMSEPQKMASDHIGSIMLRMIWSSMNNDGDVIGKLQIK